MKFSEGGKIISKKKHACGGNQWLITRTGADVKLKCLTCGHAVFLSVDKLEKITKQYEQPLDSGELDNATI